MKKEARKLAQVGQPQLFESTIKFPILEPHRWQTTGKDFFENFLNNPIGELQDRNHTRKAQILL